MNRLVITHVEVPGIFRIVIHVVKNDAVILLLFADLSKTYVEQTSSVEVLFVNLRKKNLGLVYTEHQRQCRVNAVMMLVTSSH